MEQTEQQSTSNWLTQVHLENSH